MSEESQAVGEVAGATKEFIGMCRDVLGVFTEPLKIKKTAQAEAEAIAIINEAKLEAERKDFGQRAMFRFISEQMYRQTNLETILSDVPKLLTDNVDPYKVSEDWLHRFAESAEKCGEEDLQKIWSNIMAQEVNSPGSISFRTLEQVKLFNKSDALLIEKIAPYVVKRGDVNFIIENQDKPWEDIGINYIEWRKLQDIGILQSSNSAYKITQNELMLFGNGGLLYGAENTQIGEKEFTIFLLTNFGREIVTILKSKERNSGYMKKIQNYFRSLHLYFNHLFSSKTYTNGYKIYCIEEIN